MESRFGLSSVHKNQCPQQPLGAVGYGHDSVCHLEQLPESSELGNAHAKYVALIKFREQIARISGTPLLLLVI